MANECLTEITAAAAGKLSDGELTRLVEIFQDVQAARGAQQGLESLDTALTLEAGEQLSKVEKQALRKKREVLDAIVKGKDLMDLSARAFTETGDASMGLQAAMVGVNAPFFGARASVDAKANGLFNTIVGGLFNEIQEGNLTLLFNSRLEVDELNLSREIADLTDTPTGTATKSADAKKIAAIIVKWQKVSVALENRAGADVQLRQGRIVRSTHDAGRMLKGGRTPAEALQNWIAFERGLINWKIMKVEPDKIDGVLRDVWRNITTGGLKEDVEIAVLDPKINIAERAEAKRRLVYKDADSWYAHNKAYGYRTLKEALLQDFRQAAQTTALMDSFGVRPGAMLERIKQRLRNLHVDDPKQVALIDNRRLTSQFKEVSGDINIDQGGTHFYDSANFGRSVRAIASMAKLGASFLTSTVDPFFAAAANRRIYGGIFKPHANAFEAVFKGMTDAQTKRVAKLLGLGMDTQLGEISQRFHAQDNLSGRTAEAMRLFFKWNLLGPWTDANKRGIGVMRANELGDLASKDFASLPKGWRVFLERFGFDDQRWEVARSAVVKDEGKNFMFPGEVHRGSEGSAVLEGLTPREREALQDEVRSALGALYADTTDAATPTPGARERAILRQGLEPGMATGELMRYFAQLKGFPVTVSTKVLGPIVFGQGISAKGEGTLRQVIKSMVKGEGDVLGLITVIAGTTIMGSLSTQALQLSKGRELLPWDEKLMLQGFIRGGAGGLYADFLLAENQRFGRGLVKSLAGPVFSELDTAGRLLAQLQAGEKTRAGTIRFVQSNLPGQNLFYAKAALDYLIFYQLQEMANPGYLRRMERGFKSSRGQGFHIPPSTVIPRGGGVPRLGL